MAKCEICNKEIDSDDLIEYSIRLEKKGKDKVAHEFLTPKTLSICEQCDNKKGRILTNLIELLKKEIPPIDVADYIKSSEFIYILWFETESTGLIATEAGEKMWFNSKEVFEKAEQIAKDNNKNVLVQKGFDVWRINPNGDKEHL